MPESPRPEYSVVVPVYKSAATLKQLCSITHQTFMQLGNTYELILVNDAGSENSWQAIKELKAAFPQNIKAVNLNINLGQHSATLCGFHYASGRFIITIDDDMQFSPSDIPLLIAQRQLTDADIVYATLTNRKHALIRNIASRIAFFLFRIFLGTPKTGTAFRLIDSKIIDKIKTINPPIIFIDAMMIPFITNRQQVAVSHSPRTIGKSGHTVIRQTLFTLRILFAYSSNAVRIITGMVVLLLSLFFAATGVWCYKNSLLSGILLVAIGVCVLLLYIFIAAEYALLWMKKRNEKIDFFEKEVLL